MIFVKHAKSGNEANLHSCNFSKHGYSKSKCHNLHNVQLFFVSVQRTAQTSFRIFLQTRIMVEGAKSRVMVEAAIFKSQLLKMAAAGKIQISL